MRNLLELLALILTFPLALALPAAEPDKDAKPTDIEKQAKAFLDLLAQGEFAKATKDFDATMQKALPADKLEATWKYQIGQAGAFQKQLGTRLEKKGKYEIVHVNCQFAKHNLDVNVVFDSDHHIAGLFFLPDYVAPAYVQRQSFQERAVTVGEGEWQLPGTLAMPVGDGPFPAVVLVHGSGPHDRDETIGPNKPFRDLAWGLASRGIAVLRYEKRTKEHGAKLGPVMSKFTIKEETIDDALAAVALLRKTDKVDAKKVFVLGHSLGATCAPRIGQRDPAIAGLIAMAGMTRPFEDVLVEQFDYILSLGGMPDEQKKQVETLRQQAKDLKNISLTPETPASKLPFGMTAIYLLSVNDCKPVETAAKLKQPLLILHGERDYQVDKEDFRNWQKASPSANVVLKSYPKLNHCFIEGEGKARPEEYQKTGHVAKEVIEDLAAWIKKN